MLSCKTKHCYSKKKSRCLPEDKIYRTSVLIHFTLVPILGIFFLCVEKHSESLAYLEGLPYSILTRPFPGRGQYNFALIVLLAVDQR